MRHSDVRAPLRHSGQRLPATAPAKWNGVVFVVKRFAEVQQAALFRREEKDQPHHDRERRVVERFRFDAIKQGAVAFLVEGIERLHQHLDGFAHLIAELVSDLLLVAGAFLEQGRQGAIGSDAEEAAHAEQGMEGAQSDGLIEPQRSIPRGVAGGLAAWA